VTRGRLVPGHHPRTLSSSGRGGRLLKLIGPSTPSRVGHNCGDLKTTGHLMCLQPSSLWLKYTHVIYNARKLSVCDSVLTSSEKESFIALT
jgi:hypothetical protein